MIIHLMMKRRRPLKFIVVIYIGEGWKTLVLMNRGMWDQTNCKLFPRTARCVRDSGIPAVEVFLLV